MYRVIILACIIFFSLPSALLFAEKTTITDKTTVEKLQPPAPPAAWSAAPAWSIDPKTKCRVWNEEPVPNDSFTWSGACKDGLADGQGVLQWIKYGRPGAKFEGTYLQGKMSGKGTYATVSGKRYEGLFANNMFQGKGIYTWPDGRRYEGDFAGDMFQGKGILTWSDGRRYEGDFQSDKFNGIGVLFKADGVVLRGKFKDGEFVSPSPTSI